MRKFILVILDGAADRGRSAFASARKPWLDMLASNSSCGVWSGPHAPSADRNHRFHSVSNPRNMSSVATLEILGYSYTDEPGRGYLEALGMGLRPKKGSVYVRGNFACVADNMKLIDRRAGREEAGLDDIVKEINRSIKSINGVRVKLYRLFGHRIVLVLEGKRLSRRVSDGDIGKSAKKIVPLEPSASKTAEILNQFVVESRKLMISHSANRKRRVKANFVLLRSAGSFQRVQSFERRYSLKACSISGVNIIRGISKYLGISVADVPFSQVETDLDMRMNKVVDALDKYDFIIFHINGADTFAHNKDFKGKVEYIERIDREVFSKLMKLRAVNMAVISDHVTDSRSGEHMFGAVPFLVYSSDEEDGNHVDVFSERKCGKCFVADNPMKKISSVM